MPDTYDIYRQWCLDRGHKPPSRKWWDRAITQPKTVIFEPDFDYGQERKHWGDDWS